jgi:hypothetical protein
LYFSDHFKMAILKVGSCVLSGNGIRRNGNWRLILTT